MVSIDLHIAEHKKSLSFIYFLAICNILFVMLAAKFSNLSIADLTRDVSVYTKASPLVGYLSQVGIVIWAYTTAVCYLTSTTLKPINKYYNFFFLSSIFTFILCLDDLFLLHEELFPKMLHIPEKLVFLAYGLSILGYVVHFRKVVFRGNKLLLVALFFFAISVGLDVTIDQVLLEDSTKFLGIVSWFSYFFTKANNMLVLQKPERW